MTKEQSALLLLSLGIGFALTVDICEYQKNGAHLAHPANCNKFVECQNGKTDRILNCPLGLHFNRFKSVCDLRQRAGCDMDFVNFISEEGNCSACCAIYGCYVKPDCPEIPGTPTTTVAPDSTITPETPTPESSEIPSTPATPVSPDSTITPETSTSESPQTSGTPETPVTPNSTLTPETSTPESPQTPGTTPTPISPDSTLTAETPTPESPVTPNSTATSGTPSVPAESPSTSSSSVTTDIPGTLATPTSPATPISSETPYTHSTPKSTETPGTPINPNTTVSPETPNTHSSPESTETPITPTNPNTPVSSETPNTHSTPKSTETPITPTNPNTPVSPYSPTIPDITDTAGTPTPKTSTTCHNNLTYCQGEADNSVAHVNGTCNQYIICVAGCSYIMDCPDGLQYDLAKRICDYPQNVNCPWHSTPPITGPSGVTCAHHGQCANQPDGTLFAGPKTNGYIICQCECEIERPCPEGTKFDEQLLTCAWPVKLTFGENVSGIIKDGERIKASVCPNKVEICKNQTEGQLFPVEGVCNKFYKCNYGCAVEILCPNNLIYNPKAKYCDYPQNYQCPWPHTPPSGPSAGPSGIACASGGRCVGKADGILLPSLTSCSKYVVCQCECEVERKCSKNLYWDNKLSTCNYPANVTCDLN